MKHTILFFSLIAAQMSFAAPSASPVQMPDSCLESISMKVIKHLQTLKPKSDLHLVKEDQGRVIGLTDSEDIYGNFDITSIQNSYNSKLFPRMKVQMSDSQTTVIIEAELKNGKGQDTCKIVGFQSLQAQAQPMTCTETAQSKKDYDYERVLTVQVSADQKKILITAPATEDYLAIAEVVQQDNHDSSQDEDGNLNEDYSAEKESRYLGSDDITSTDTGTNLFFAKEILAGKPGILRLTSGQGNESDSGPAINWYDTATLNCQ